MRGTSGVLVFVDEAEATGPCVVCGGLMGVEKTVLRHGTTLEHGRFRARETVYACERQLRFVEI